jgi:hypothetical protein
MSAGRSIALASALALVAVTSACATFQYGGGKQTIKITTRPPGATALVLPDETRIVTPASITVERRHALTIRIELEGYCRETIYLDRVISVGRDAPLPFGLGIGMWIDTWSGAAYRLRPEKVEVVLWPEQSADRECGPVSSMPRKMPLPPTEPL